MQRRHEMESYKCSSETRENIKIGGNQKNPNWSFEKIDKTDKSLEK